MPRDNDTKNVPLNNNGWTKWGQHVLAELERQDECICKLIDKVEQLRVEEALLKLKSGIWGVAGASIPILIFIIGWLLKSIFIGP